MSQNTGPCRVYIGKVSVTEVPAANFLTGSVNSKQSPVQMPLMPGEPMLLATYSSFCLYWSLGSDALIHFAWAWVCDGHIQRPSVSHCGCVAAEKTGRLFSYPSGKTTGNVTGMMPSLPALRYCFDTSPAASTVPASSALARIVSELARSFLSVNATSNPPSGTVQGATTSGTFV